MSKFFAQRASFSSPERDYDPESNSSPIIDPNARPKVRDHFVAASGEFITLGLVLSGGLPWARGLILFPAQILGAVSAAAVVSVMFPPSISMVNTLLAPGTSIAQGLFMEMFLTCLLMITVLMLASEKSKDTFLAPVGIGLSLFVAELAGIAPCPL
ncbi:putative Aquaporin-1 [Glarea lozoyensis 74030]|uniref:Putative Aquaporin-1 n=1 Tax=Glarea lozoyensis (strain ATCC 74030 / MF5533) TaxID=1104152 RepID=H0EYW4_GLAL7|nr:putative Aquaporin-1 [Glarea lozoyensis 74030]